MEHTTQTQDEVQKGGHPLSRMLKTHGHLISSLKEGDVVDVTLLHKDKKKAYFDIPTYGATGIVFGIEFLSAQHIIKKMTEDSSLPATVIVPENEDGYVELSLVRALRQQSWKEIKNLKDGGEICSVIIKAANTGGLITELFGVKAFIPVSQLSTENYPHVEDGNKNKILEELKKFVGQEMKVKVLDFNQKNDKLILSEKEVLGEQVKKTLSSYNEGDIVDVTVSGIADFGVFVRFVEDPNVEGLIHISELDHKLIESPKEIVDVGDSVKAKIIEIKEGKVSLSLKSLKPNPWDDAEKHFTVDQEVQGQVSAFNQFGALVTLDHGIQGLIHVSEFESPEHMRETIKEGETYTFVVNQLKPDEKRAILTLKK